MSKLEQIKLAREILDKEGVFIVYKTRVAEVSREGELIVNGLVLNKPQALSLYKWMHNIYGDEI